MDFVLSGSFSFSNTYIARAMGSAQRPSWRWHLSGVTLAITSLRIWGKSEVGGDFLDIAGKAVNRGTAEDAVIMVGVLRPYFLASASMSSYAGTNGFFKFEIVACCYLAVRIPYWTSSI